MQMTYSACLAVMDYMDDEDPSPEIAFDDAAEDSEAAVEEFLDWAKESLSEAEVATLSASAAFEEFDSGNWTHAGAHYAVEVEGPVELIARLQARYDREFLGEESAAAGSDDEE